MARLGAKILNLPGLEPKDRLEIQERLREIESIVNRNANSSEWVSALPTASSELAGRMVVLNDGGAGGGGAEVDELYICMRKGTPGAYTWELVT